MPERSPLAGLAHHHLSLLRAANRPQQKQLTTKRFNWWSASRALKPWRQMTREKSWRGDACTPRWERFPRALPGVLCAGREADPPGRVWAYGSLSSPEGRTDREHPTAQPALPHHPASPQPRPQRQEKAESSGESVSQVGTLGLSIALHPKGLAESPLKPLVLKLVRSLVLINEHSPGQGQEEWRAL